MLNFYVEKVAINEFYFIQITAVGTLVIPESPSNPSFTLPNKYNATLTFKDLFKKRPGDLKVLGSFYNSNPNITDKDGITPELKISHFETNSTENYTPLFTRHPGSTTIDPYEFRNVMFTTQALVPGNPPPLIAGDILGSVILYLVKKDDNSTIIHPGDFFDTLSDSPTGGKVHLGLLAYQDTIGPVGDWCVL